MPGAYRVAGEFGRVRHRRQRGDALNRLTLLAAFLVVAVSVAAAATFMLDQDDDTASQAVALPDLDTDGAAEPCSVCAARHQRLLRNRKSED
jgi:2-methylcitrate dehydratase PrpD